MRTPWRAATILAATAFLAAASACFTPGLRLDRSIPLVRHEPYEDHFRNMDYSLAYRYTLEGDASSGTDLLMFSGQLTPRRGLATFVLRLHILDAAGGVLGTETLYSPGAGHGAGRASFDRRIEVTDEAAGIAFSHIARENRGPPRFRP